MTAPAEQSDVVDDGPSEQPPDGEPEATEERGSFTHGVCRRCGWAGPGRRSRGRARADVAAHQEADCQA